jgi:hypothetical protein
LVAAGVDRWAVAPSSDVYEVEVYPAGASRGDPAAIVHFCQPVSDDEIAAARTKDWMLDPDTLEFGLQGLTEELQRAGSPANPALFHRIVLDRNGRVWVERDAPVPVSLDLLYGVPGARLDVFRPYKMYTTPPVNSRSVRPPVFSSNEVTVRAGRH